MTPTLLWKGLNSIGSPPHPFTSHHMCTASNVSPPMWTAANFLMPRMKPVANRLQAPQCTVTAWWALYNTWPPLAIMPCRCSCPIWHYWHNWHLPWNEPQHSWAAINTLGYPTPWSCCCSLCYVRASLQSPCRVLWSCVLHSISSVIVSWVMGLYVVSGDCSRTTFIVLWVSHCVCVLSSLSIVFLCIYAAVDWELTPQSHSLHCSPLGALSLKGPLSCVFNRGLMSLDRCA